MQNEFDYRKYLNLLFKHKRLFAITALIVMSLGVVISYVLPKKYEASSKILIQRSVITELIQGIAVAPSTEQVTRGIMDAITSRTLVLKVINELDINAKTKNDAELEDLIRTTQKNIMVDLKEQNLLTITYKDNNPRIARDFVNTLVRAYIQQSVSSKREDSYDAIKFISEQIETSKSKLAKTEDELNRYKTEKGAVIVADPAQLFIDINTSQQRLYEVQLRRRHLEELRPIARRAADPLQAQLATLQKQLEELKVSYTENYPEVVRIKGDIETLKQQMKGRVYQGEAIVDPQEIQRNDAEVAALKASEEALKRHIATNQTLLNSVPSSKGKLEQLELEKRNNEELLNQLMTRHGQSELSKQMEVQDKTTSFRIVDPAVLPIKPIFPNRVKFILMGIAAGIAAGFGILLALDYIDSSVKSVDTIKALGINVLAVIPNISDPQSIEKERRSDLRLYLASGAYFSMIVSLLALEVLSLSPVDMIIGLISG